MFYSVFDKKSFYLKTAFSPLPYGNKKLLNDYLSTQRCSVVTLVASKRLGISGRMRAINHRVSKLEIYLLLSLSAFYISSSSRDPMPYFIRFQEVIARH